MVVVVVTPGRRETAEATDLLKPPEPLTT